MCWQQPGLLFGIRVAVVTCNLDFENMSRTFARYAKLYLVGILTIQNNHHTTTMKTFYNDLDSEVRYPVARTIQLIQSAGVPF